VVLKKRTRQRFWNRRETVDDKIDVVQVPWLDRPPVCPKLCGDCQTARQCTPKAVSEDCLNNLGRPPGIVSVQQCREHGQ
jgi:hypothetical protein